MVGRLPEGAGGVQVNLRKTDLIMLHRICDRGSYLYVRGERQQLDRLHALGLVEGAGLYGVKLTDKGLAELEKHPEERAS